MAEPCYDVVVVGGGIVGLAAGYRLARAGARVAVVERERPGLGASGAAAGILAPGHEGRGDPVLLELAVRSYGLWGDLAAELERATGVRVGFVERGTVVVAEDDGAAAELRERAARPGPAGPAEWWEPDRLPPYLRPFRDLRGALRLARGAHLEPPAATAALAAAFGEVGDLLTGEEVAGFETEPAAGGRRVTAVLTGTRTLRCGAVVLAGGVQTAGLAAWLGTPLPVIPVRGQILSVRTPPALRAWQEAMVPVFGARVYLVPKADGRTVIGATEEWDAGHDRTVTLGGLAELAAAAVALLPGLDGAAFVAAWAGLRPGTPDRRPLLGPLPGYANAFVASGHFRHGVLLAPLTARVVADLCAGRRPEVDLAPLDPGRFAAAPARGEAGA